MKIGQFLCYVFCFLSFGSRALTAHKTQKDQKVLKCKLMNKLYKLVETFGPTHKTTYQRSPALYTPYGVYWASRSVSAIDYGYDGLSLGL